MICNPEESGEKVTDDLLVAQVGIDLACFAGLGEEVLDLCSPLTRGPFVAFGEAGVGECFLPERDDQTASSRLVASSGRISRQHDRSAAGLVRCGRRRPTAGPPWWRGTRTGPWHSQPRWRSRSSWLRPSHPEHRSPRGLDELDSTLLMINNFRHVRGSGLLAAAGIRRAGRGPGRGVEARVPRFRASLTRCAECGLGARRPRFGGRDLQDRRR